MLPRKPQIPFPDPSLWYLGSTTRHRSPPDFTMGLSKTETINEVNNTVNGVVQYCVLYGDRRVMNHDSSDGFHGHPINVFWLVTARRYASAVCCPRVSVRLSVCLSHVDIVPKWLNVGSPNNAVLSIARESNLLMPKISAKFQRVL